MDGIINALGAIFTGLISLVGVIITNSMSNKTIENKCTIKFSLQLFKFNIITYHYSNVLILLLYSRKYRLD